MARLPKSLESRVYLYRFADDFMLIYPFYALLFAESGLSTAQISMLFVGWSVIGIAAEIPTGALGDRFDRRYLLALGQLTKAVGFGCWFIFSDFTGYLAGFALWGIGSAFSSGTYEALVYDELDKQGRREQYLRVAGRSASVALVAILLATALASLVASPGYDIAILASVGASCIAALAALSLPKASRVASTKQTPYLETIKVGLRLSIRSKRLGVAILLAAVAGSAYGALEEYSGLFISDLGYSAAVVALILTAIGITDALGAFSAERVEKARTGGIFALVAVASVSLIAASLLQSAASVPLLAAFFFLTQAAMIISESRVQHSIDSTEHRATATSVANFAIEIASLGVFATFAIAGSQDRFVGFIACALVLLLSAVAASTADRRLAKTGPS
jgi:MFS family permease